MKYDSIIPHWYKVDHKYILIDDQHALIGHFEHVGNQIHREIIRRAENKPQEGKK